MNRELIPRVLTAVVVLLVVQRFAYHATYLAENPFALGTFSDGGLYERAATDLVEHPPWGTRPFYLQGIYSVLLALPMPWKAGPAGGLLLQLLIVGLGLFAFHRACRWMYGHNVGAGCTIVLLAYPGLAFYENKFLTAGIAEASLCFMLLALVWMCREPRWWAAVGFGVATGFAILARGNMVLGLPAFGIAVYLLGRHHQRARGTIAAWVLGVLVALAPMALRNAVVTGSPTIFPAHGGGTSFYIGNNAASKGVWNSAGGLLSGDVGRERDELVEKLGIPEGTEAEQAAAIGRALYQRAFAEMGEDPGRWLHLEAKKVWLLTGNQELAQDYDALGEAELVGYIREFGLPFSVLLALGLCGVAAVRWPRDSTRGDAESEPPTIDTDTSAFRRAWLWTLGGMAVAVLAANILFFTSAQHRVPLAVVLGAFAGPGAVWAMARARGVEWPTYKRVGLILIVSAVVAQGWASRARVRERPSAAHYHNLALVQVELGDPRGAVVTLSLALEYRPEHPVIRIERASLFRKLGRFELAATDLDILDAQPDKPAWVVARMHHERQWLAAFAKVR